NSYGGTSFAAPMWAGYLALVNQQSVANGHSAVGFINPSLYAIGEGSSYGSDFHDIVSGSNGYSATTRYDLATGWGSPNGTGLINALVGSATPPPLPSTPTNLTAAPGNGQVTLSWSAATGAASYNLYRKIGRASCRERADVTGIASTSYTNIGLTNGSTYDFTVDPVSSSSTTGQSHHNSAAPTAPPPAPPSTPTNLTAAPGNGQVTLSWSAATGAASYNLYRSTTSGGEGSTPVVTGIASTSYTNTGLTNGITYYFRVAAVNASGTSGQRSEARTSQL